MSEPSILWRYFDKYFRGKYDQNMQDRRMWKKGV